MVVCEEKLQVEARPLSCQFKSGIRIASGRRRGAT